MATKPTRAGADGRRGDARRPRVCVISGSDSDLGGLEPVAKELRAAGASVRWIGVGPANRKPPPLPRVMVPAIAPPKGQVDQMARYVADVQRHVTEILVRMRPEFVVLLGDRHEILAAACAAAMLRIPIGHIHAGELALGQTDNRVRLAVSRLSDLLFAPDEKSYRRLLAWGELRNRVFHVGSPFTDSLCPIKPMRQRRGLKPFEYVMCIYHSVRPDDAWEYREAGKVLAKVEAARRRLARKLGHEIRMIFFEPSPDPGRDGIIRRWREVAKARPGVALYQERLGRPEFLRLLTHAAHIIANSSGLFTEAVPLGVPMTLVGRRQKGRTLSAPRAAHRPVLKRPLAGGPYGGPGASRKIARAILRALRQGAMGRAKEFQDIR